MSEQSGSGLGKTLMPVPEGHPDVFERSWPLRVADIDRTVAFWRDVMGLRLDDMVPGMYQPRT